MGGICACVGPLGGQLSPHPWRFRPEIEGLRALAILLVVGSHAGVPGMPGGFVGVDIFFLMSGFLITGLLLEEHRRTGRVGFAAFFARRFGRLLPALAVMLVATSWLAAHLLLPVHQGDQAIAAATAGLWTSNLHFAFGAIEYFEPEARSNLYLHTWSLSVEEQFYLLWPLVITLALAGVNASRTRLFAVLLAVLVVSFLGSLLVTSSSATLAFYLMPTRAWQFALGGMVFLLVTEGRNGEGVGGARSSTVLFERRGVPDVIALIGLTMIFTAVVHFHDGEPYPGLRAVLPTAGAALLLGALSLPSSRWVSFLLSRSPMQFLGRLSYGWYLWHWPILVLGETVIDLVPLENRLVLVLLALLPAWLSYSVLEGPVRSAARRAMPGHVIGLAIICMGALLWNALAWHGRATEQATSAPTARTLAPNIGADCDQWYRSAELRPCEFPHGSSTRTVILMGDSIGMQWFPAWKRLAEENEWRLVVLTKSACPMVDVSVYYARIGRTYVECDLWRSRAIEWVRSEMADTVVLGSSSTYPFSEKEWQEGTRRILNAIQPTSGHVVLMLPTPILPFDGPGCSLPRGALHAWLAQPKRCRAPAQDERSERVFRGLYGAQLGLSNVSVLDMSDLVCPGGVCRSLIDGKLVYRDHQHLDAAFVEKITRQLESRIALE